MVNPIHVDNGNLESIRKSDSLERIRMLVFVRVVYTFVDIFHFHFSFYSNLLNFEHLF